MKVEAVYHRPRNEFAYYDTNGTATILLRVGSNDILRARLFWFDKYCIDESIAAVEMESILSDSLFSYFRISITPKYRRLQYYFELMDRSGAVWYLDMRLLTECLAAGVRRLRRQGTLQKSR